MNPVKSPYILLTFILLLVSLTQSYAYFEVLKLNTTVTLSTNTSGKVVEVLTLFVSNSSIQQYKADRAALNLSLNNWNSELGTTLLTPHILNPRSSISNFTFLPGPVLIVGTSGGEATLTMSYIANNITYIRPIEPRRFEYFFNSSALNFEHTASGEQLFSNARLNLIIPNSAIFLQLCEQLLFWHLPFCIFLPFFGNCVPLLLLLLYLYETLFLQVLQSPEKRSTVQTALF